MLKVFLKRTVLRNISPRASWSVLERALNNAVVGVFAKDPLVSRGRDYRVRSVVEVTPEVSTQAFARCANAHVTAFGAATLPLNRPQVRGIDPSELRLSGPYQPELGPIPPADFLESSTSPPLTLTSLADALCLPDQVILARNRAAPADDWFVVDASFTSALDRGNHREIARLDTDVFRIKRSAAQFEARPGDYLFLDCVHRDHFGHFLVDVMSMTWAFNKAREFGIDRLRALTTAKPAPFMFPLLSAMGISHDVIVPVRQPMRCERLFIASKSFLTQGYTSPAAVATWRQIRDALDRGKGPERIYISRSRQPSRRLRNENAVEALFAARDFQLVHPENLSIEEQITLWANARLVAGTAGSSMFGLAFQRQLERSFLICSPNLIQFSELMLQAGCTSATTLYVGRAHGADAHAPWSVDIADLAREVDRWQ